MDQNIFQAFTRHASGGPDTPNDYVATKIAALKMFPKLAMGLDSHALLAQSLYHHGGADAVSRMAIANPAHRSGILQGIKNIGPAAGGVRSIGSNPLRAAASGVLHAKLASLFANTLSGGLTDVARRAAQAGKLRPPVQPVKQVAQTVLKKQASFIHPAAEMAGLGMLGAPVVKTLRDPRATAKERSHAKWEAAGLGTLGAVTGHEMWQALRKPAVAAATHL